MSAVLEERNTLPSKEKEMHKNIFKAPASISDRTRGVLDHLISGISSKRGHFIGVLDTAISDISHDIFLICGPKSNGFVLLGLKDEGLTEADLSQISNAIKANALSTVKSNHLSSETISSYKNAFRISNLLIDRKASLSENIWETHLSSGEPPTELEEIWKFLCPEQSEKDYIPYNLSQRRHVFAPKNDEEWIRFEKIFKTTIEQAADGCNFSYDDCYVRPLQISSRTQFLPILLLAALLHWKWGKLVSGGSTFRIGIMSDDFHFNKNVKTLFGYTLTGFEAEDIGLAMLVLADLIRRNKKRNDKGELFIDSVAICKKPFLWLESNGYHTAILRSFLESTEKKGVHNG